MEENSLFVQTGNERASPGTARTSILGGYALLTTHAGRANGEI